jgi:hypothetical protein
MKLRETNARRTVDVFFVGYPKTGNTWLRFMLGSYLQEAHGLAEPPLFDEFDRLGRAKTISNVPGMTFTHEPLEWTSQTAGDLTAANVVERFRGKRVVLLARHPLDALVSMWHQRRTRVEPRYEGDIVSFVDSPVYGLEKLLRFYELWEQAYQPGFPILVVRYEDLRQDPAGQLERVLDFIGAAPAEPAAVGAAVERASFSRMQALERSGGAPRYASSGLGIFATGDPSDPNAFHVRRGEIGGYRDEVPPNVLPGYERRVAAAMGGRYGYDAPPATVGATPASA